MHDPLCVAFEIRRPWPKHYTTKQGRRRYWPPLITVWHREPAGHDAGTVCKYSSHKWHVHHWKIQVRPLQALRRQLLTRCAWCGGKQRKGDSICIGGSWDGGRGHFWHGEPNLRHLDCDSVWRAHRACLCDLPGLPSSGYGQCSRCGRFRAWGATPSEAHRLMASLEYGERVPAEMKPKLEALWAEAKASADL